MQRDDALRILKQVEQVAALAGMRLRMDPAAGHLVFGVRLSETRTQQVFVRPAGTAGDKVVVRVFSPARVVPKGFFSGLSKEAALELLRLNEDLLFARFGIWDTEKQSMIVASSDLLLETADAEEFQAQALLVARAADAYEAKHGKTDEF